MARKLRHRSNGMAVTANRGDNHLGNSLFATDEQMLTLPVKHNSSQQLRLKSK